MTTKKDKGDPVFSLQKKADGQNAEAALRRCL